jgi:hypothetical protein
LNGFLKPKASDTATGYKFSSLINAVANGNLAKPVAVEAESQPLRGEFLSTAEIISLFVSPCSYLASRPDASRFTRYGSRASLNSARAKFFT